MEGVWVPRVGLDLTKPSLTCTQLVQLPQHCSQGLRPLRGLGHPPGRPPDQEWRKGQGQSWLWDQLQQSVIFLEIRATTVQRGQWVKLTWGARVSERCQGWTVAGAVNAPLHPGALAPSRTRTLWVPLCPQTAPDVRTWPPGLGTGLAYDIGL